MYLFGCVAAHWILLQRAGSVIVACGLSSCGARALEHADLVAPRHVGS